MNDEEMPRGLRNNNPGNLMDFGIKWNGMTGVDDAGYCIFETLTNGIRAMALDLLSDNLKGGKNTVEKLVTEFAPETHGNPTAVYVAYVAKGLGVTRNDNLRLDNQITMRSMVQLMTTFELGKRWALPLDVIASGVSAAFLYRKIA